MARWACDEDGWRSDYHREVAESHARDDVRYYYGEELRAIVRMIDPETGDGWPEAERAADRLADRMADATDLPFTSIELAAIIVEMIEGGEGCES